MSSEAQESNAKLGATVMDGQATQFRVWAPRRQTVEVELQGGGSTTIHPLAREEFGYFSGTVDGAFSGMKYAYRLDGGASRPDPMSRFQPDGVHGPSQIVAPNSFTWSDQLWSGVAKRDLVIYELHIGTFTAAGTFAAAIQRLDRLIELGITAIELMPVAQSPGRWNWGYDGVNLFAVRNTYGRPDELKALVDACHQRGLAVLLDVVYNHLGPEGNYLSEFGPYFSRKHRTPWGEALNFDGRHAQHVRKFIVENALFWLREYHLDGLRLDAVHFMVDDSEVTILDEIRQAVTQFAASQDRQIHLIAEANVYDQEILSPGGKRQPYDAAWCDCLMHSVYGHALPDLQLAHREYRGAGDLVEVLRHGFLYAGRHPQRVDDQAREEIHKVADWAAVVSSFVAGLQTHDAVGNHPHGRRLHHLTSTAYQQAAAALVLLYPSIPLIFMGEEVATAATFPFFADFEDTGLRKAVDVGRSQEYAHHDWQGAPLPSAESTFFQANDHDTGQHDQEMFAWYQQLLGLRTQGLRAGWLAAERMSVDCEPENHLFCLRFDARDQGEIVVVSRLVPVAKAQADALDLPQNGEILLSTAGVTMEKGTLRIPENQAVVFLLEH